MQTTYSQQATIIIPRPHARQHEFIYSPAKRKVIRAGRRSGKTVGVSVYAVMRFLAGKRILYAAPTTEQLDSFWSIVTEALYEPIKLGALYKNETEHIIEVSHTKNRIRAKTAWSADTLRLGGRGDFAGGGQLLAAFAFGLPEEANWQ